MGVDVIKGDPKRGWFDAAASARPYPSSASEFGRYDAEEGLEPYPRVPSDDLVGFAYAGGTPEADEYLAGYHSVTGRGHGVLSSTGDICRGCGGKRVNVYREQDGSKTTFPCQMCGETGFQSIAALPEPFPFRAPL